MNDSMLEYLSRNRISIQVYNKENIFFRENNVFHNDTPFGRGGFNQGQVNSRLRS